MSHLPRRSFGVLIAPALVLSLAACSTGGAPAASAGSSAAPSKAPASPSTSGIEHPTGATDVVLRYEEGGGFVPMISSTFSAARALSLTMPERFSSSTTPMAMNASRSAAREASEPFTMPTPTATSQP